MAPGSSGTSLSRAAAKTSLVAPGLTMNFEPALAACSNCAALRIVPAPTTASGTSAAARRIASSASGVRMVISITGRPPRASARASGTALLASSIFSTGMTGWPFSNAISLSVLADMECLSVGVVAHRLAERGPGASTKASRLATAPTMALGACA